MRNSKAAFFVALNLLRQVFFISAAPISKKCTTFAVDLYIQSWADNPNLFDYKINGNAYYGGGMETIRYITPSVCGDHTYGGRCFLSQFFLL